MTVEELIALQAKIAENQRRFEQIPESRWRFVPFWVLRKQYAIIKENEPLFKKLGFEWDKLWVEREGSWLLKRLIGVR